MILFFVTEKSVIPVKGALESKKNPLSKSVRKQEGNPLGPHTVLNMLTSLDLNKLS